MDIHQYDDIINLPHHRSKTRPHMSLEDRAAQFSPFAALTGHDEAIEETARLTDRKIELDEDAKARLNEKLQYIAENLGTELEVAITYFVPDNAKTGGEYVTKRGIVKKIDQYRNAIIMTGREEICIADIVEIEVQVENKDRIN